MQKKDILWFLFGVLALVLINLSAAQIFFRIDLTEDRRYSLTPATKRLLENLDEDIVIKVYLEGNFPAGFKRLQAAVKETLEEFKIYGGSRVKYRFIDPSKAGSPEEVQELYKSLVEKGIPPTNVFATEDGKKTEKLIFPGAVIVYKNFEISTLLFKTLDQRIQGAPSPESILNQSVENVEYNLAAALRKLTVKDQDRKNIAFVEGHGELGNKELADILETMSATHKVYKVDLPKEKEIIGLDVLVIAGPDTTFSEADKYKLDQYIMNGGKVLFCLDAVGIYMDSVLQDKGSFSFPYNHNLTDQLFRYGVKLQNDLIKDLNCGFIPMVIGNMGDQTKIQPVPWQYYPLINSFAPNHPITKNLDALYTKFVGSIDTVKADGVKKTPLLFTSKYSQKVETPAFVTFNEARLEQNPAAYNAGAVPVAYLLEGNFKSLYKDRIAPTDARHKQFKEKSIPTKLIVCSDGDLIRSDIDRKTGNPLPLGYDKYSRYTFSNKDFIVNSIEYLLDEEGIISARRKEVALRPLDKYKLENEKTFWRWLNMLLPVFFVVLFGTARYFFRQYRFAR